MPRPGRPFTDAEDDFLYESCFIGDMTQQRAAKMLARTIHSIEGRMKILRRKRRGIMYWFAHKMPVPTSIDLGYLK